MVVIKSWTLLGVPKVTPFAAPVLEQVATQDPTAYLGFGLLSPFSRDKKNDFANAGGIPLLQSAIRQVLGTRGASDTRQGELPWRTEFGSLVHLLRHNNNDGVLDELARVRVVDAIERWEPRVQVTDVLLEKKDNPAIGAGTLTVLVVRVFYDVIEQNVAGNTVILPNQSVEVTL